MFANFIYFIIAILIYTTYHPAENPNFSPLESGIFFLALLGFFAGFTWLQFHHLEKRLGRDSIRKIDHKFSNLITRQSILAVLLFAVDIYGLNLSSFLLNIQLFIRIPTLQAVLFLLLFIFYLSVVWGFAHRLYVTLYRSQITRASYIVSNISFSIPVLLPWVLLSGVADIIRILPFQLPKQALGTTEGEIIYFLVFLFAVAIFGPVMIQKFWRCVPLEPGAHRIRIESLCHAAKLGYKDILHWPIFEGRMITAGVMGLIKQFRYILVTRALLDILEPIEIDAVIAHEIGHIQKKHLIFYLFFFMGYMLVSFALFDLIIYAIIYFNPVATLFNRMGFNQATVISALFSVIIILIFLIYFRFIFGYFMRNFERQADIHVYTILGNAQPLISTLKKISITSRQSADKPNWHHFSIRERIEYLKKCEIDRSWIARHHRKVRKSIIIYAMCALVLGGIGYQLNFGETGRVLNEHFFESVIIREIVKTPDNADLYAMLGDLQYHRNDFAAAVNAYENAITIDENHSRALNNLAWLFATCDDPRFQRPERALELAKRAVAVEEKAHALDTLAESYYANGNIVAAISTAIHARKMAQENTAYYDGQIEKFRKALRNEKN
jgi:Zn-dependent protease with chaperone function